MKVYTRGKYLGDTFNGDLARLDTDHYYTGLFLVFDDGIGYEGCILFSVNHGKVTCQSPKIMWKFHDKDELPQDFA